MSNNDSVKINTEPGEETILLREGPDLKTVSKRDIQILWESRVVSQLSLSERRVFLRNVLIIITCMMLGTFGVTLAVKKYGNISFFFDYPLLLLVEVVALLFLFTIQSFELFNVKQLHRQIILCMINWIVFTIFACLITYFASIELIMQVIASTSSLLFMYCLYYSQRFVNIPKWILVVCGICAITLVTYLTVYLPYRDFWTHPSMRWFHPEENLIFQVAAIGYGVMFMVQILYHIEYTFVKYTKRQYIQVATLLYSSAIMLMTLIIQQIIRIDSSRSNPYSQFNYFHQKTTLKT